MSYLKNLFSSICLAGIVLAVFHYTDFDLKFQSFFFDITKDQWYIDRNNTLLKIIFYILPKYLIFAYGVFLLLFYVKLSVSRENENLQKKILFLISCLIVIPLIVASLKHYSPIHCPQNTLNFGGAALYMSPLQVFNDRFFFDSYGRCFPAGHASGGFALISLIFVAPSKLTKFLALIISLLFGASMGLYQIAKGAHYLSDTIITLFIAYMVSITLREICLKK